MTDSLFLDEVVGFLHNIDDPMVTGSELLQSLDKNDAMLLMPGSTEIALQLLDVTPIDDLFAVNNNTDSSDSDATSVECESVTSSSSPVPIKEAVVDVRSRDAIRRSTYRLKQKANKDELHQQVAELSLQLTTLQQQKEAERVRRGMGLTQSAVWEALANRHLHARLIAEEQRSRLHQAVDKRSKLIQDLGLLVRKRISEEQPEGDLCFPTKKPRTQSPDMALYEAYLKELDNTYAQTDKVYEAIRLDASGDEFTQRYHKNSSLRRVVKDSSFHELVGKIATPFAFEKVRLMIPNVCSMANRPGSEKIEGPWIPANTTIFKSRVSSGGLSGSLVVHAITRRYNEANRVVVIWRKFTEGEGVFAGMHADETGWSVISPAEGCAGTRLESVIRFVPINFSSVVNSGATAREFADAIIKTGEEDCKMCTEMMEKLLLDDALGVC